MSVSLVHWRAGTGVFNCRILVMSKNCENYLVNNFISLIESLLLFYHCFESAYIFLFTLLYLFVLLQCHWDIELNPGPKNLKNKLLPVCHWNWNSLMAHNYSKLTQLKVYISLYKHYFFESAYIFLFTFLYLFVLLQWHGDTELNPGPKNLKNKLLKTDTW